MFGIVERTIQLSARSTDSRTHVGEMLRRCFGDVGSAGGHREMAGGEIPLGIFADQATEDTDLVDIVERVVTNRLIDELNLGEEDGRREEQRADDEE